MFCEHYINEPYPSSMSSEYLAADPQLLKNSIYSISTYGFNKPKIFLLFLLIFFVLLVLSFILLIFLVSSFFVFSACRFGYGSCVKQRTIQIKFNRVHQLVNLISDQLQTIISHVISNIRLALKLTCFVATESSCETISSARAAIHSTSDSMACFSCSHKTSGALLTELCSSED